MRMRLNNLTMDLKVKRNIFGDDYTVGDFTANGNFLANSLEDKVRIPFVKIAHKTAIPAGKYEVILDESTRFKRIMPHILNVPHFNGIRIHSGNTDEDTEGCILIGTHKSGADFIGDSRVFNEILMDILQRAVDREEKIWITIE